MEVAGGDQPPATTPVPTSRVISVEDQTMQSDSETTDQARLGSHAAKLTKCSAMFLAHTIAQRYTSEFLYEGCGQRVVHTYSEYGAGANRKYYVVARFPMTTALLP